MEVIVVVNVDQIYDQNAISISSNAITILSLCNIYFKILFWQVEVTFQFIHAVIFNMYLTNWNLLKSNFTLTLFLEHFFPKSNQKPTSLVAITLPGNLSTWYFLDAASLECRLTSFPHICDLVPKSPTLPIAFKVIKLDLPLYLNVRKHNSIKLRNSTNSLGS